VDSALSVVNRFKKQNKKNKKKNTFNIHWQKP